MGSGAGNCDRRSRRAGTCSASIGLKFTIANPWLHSSCDNPHLTLHPDGWIVKPQLILMFSGQGSQYFQMGKELYEHHPVFRRVLDRGDALVQQQLGRSLCAEIYGRPRSDVFDDLLMSHPALLVVEYAMYETLQSEGISADQVWGSSLGEMSAAAAAGVWSFESALQIVIDQARAVTATCPAGGLLAVLGNMDLYADLKNFGHDIALAGVNFKSHFTIASDPATLQAVQQSLKERDIAFQRLPLRYGFHSAALEPAQQLFLRCCAAQPVNRTPRIPFLSGATGNYVSEITPDYLWAVMRGPMRFSEAVQRLEQRGPNVFVDCGPSGTSATFVKYNLTDTSRSTVHPLLTPFHQGRQKLAQLKDHVAQLV
jgi:bacillaene synthase trans-acting acyltransferase